MREVAGLILAGGLSRRMGFDKTLATLAGKPLLAHVRDRLSPQCATLWLNANGDAARFAPFGLPVVPDDVPGFAGPLAGILAGLDAVARDAPGTQTMVSVAADTPFLPGDLVSRLKEAREREGAEIAVASSGERTHPVIALWPVGLRHDLRRALVEQGERKIDRFTAKYRVAVAAWPTGPFDPFFNVNTPADLDEGERIARGLATTSQGAA